MFCISVIVILLGSGGLFIAAWCAGGLLSVTILATALLRFSSGGKRIWSLMFVSVGCLALAIQIIFGVRASEIVKDKDAQIVAANQLRRLATAIEEYATANGVVPACLQDLISWGAIDPPNLISPSDPGYSATSPSWHRG
jgi:hypothetical protein